MKKFINQPERFIDEMLYGLYAAHPSYYTCVNEDAHCLITKHKIAGKVGIATGGGSGHLPLFLGYVGKGMLDGCSVGDVFQSPSSEQMLDVTKAIDSGAGVLYIFGNYNGDIFNFQMAAEMAEMEEDIEVCLSIAGEDVASGPRAFVEVLQAFSLCINVQVQLLRKCCHWMRCTGLQKKQSYSWQPWVLL